MWVADVWEIQGQNLACISQLQKQSWGKVPLCLDRGSHGVSVVGEGRLTKGRHETLEPFLSSSPQTGQDTNQPLHCPVKARKTRMGVGNPASSCPGRWLLFFWDVPKISTPAAAASRRWPEPQDLYMRLQWRLQHFIALTGFQIVSPLLSHSPSWLQTPRRQGLSLNFV